MTGIFVTGTDTDCGKTEISLALMAAWQAQGLRVLGMKPVATGCDHTPYGLRNRDALRLQAQGSSEAPYGLINPYALEPPIAPHIAAGQAGVDIELAPIRSAYAALAAEADLVVVEGVGGWRVPLGVRLGVSDLPLALGLPVVLVVGLKLGCLNHALLSVESIGARGASLAGWVANAVDPRMNAGEENLATLAALIDAPCIGMVPYVQNRQPSALAEYLLADLPSLSPTTSATPAPTRS
jgi:dethiobiotin synthetase